MEKVKRQVSSRVSTTVDSFGHQLIVEDTKVFTVKIDSEHFYMCFFENMSGYFKIKSMIDIKVLSILCSRAEFNTGTVNVTQTLRDIICDTVEIKKSQLSRSFKSLQEKNLIIYNRDVVEINPAAFWKGSSDERAKMLKSKSIEVKFKFTAE